MSTFEDTSQHQHILRALQQESCVKCSNKSVIAQTFKLHFFLTMAWECCFSVPWLWKLFRTSCLWASVPLYPGTWLLFCGACDCLYFGTHLQLMLERQLVGVSSWPTAQWPAQWVAGLIIKRPSEGHMGYCEVSPTVVLILCVSSSEII